MIEMNVNTDQLDGFKSKLETYVQPFFITLRFILVIYNKTLAARKCERWKLNWTAPPILLPLQRHDVSKDIRSRPSISSMIVLHPTALATHSN